MIAQWYEGTREIVETIERNYVLADEMVNAIKEGARAPEVKDSA